MSLEEAEPIPDISWSIRVLQPPPEQENAQYGELGRGRGTPPGSPSIQHRWSPFLSSRLTFLAGRGQGLRWCLRAVLLLLWTIMGSSVQASEHLLWASLGHVICSGIAEPKEARCIRGLCDHTSCRMLSLQRTGLPDQGRRSMNEPPGVRASQCGLPWPGLLCQRSAPDLQLQRRLQLAEPWAVALGLLTAASPLQLVLTLKQSLSSPATLQIKPRCPWWSCPTVGN